MDNDNDAFFIIKTWLEVRFILLSKCQALVIEELEQLIARHEVGLVLLNCVLSNLFKNIDFNGFTKVLSHDGIGNTKAGKPDGVYIFPYH